MALSVRLRRVVLAAGLLAASGCAASRAPAPEARAAPSVPGPEASAEGPAYERILGAFVISPTGFVLLDPRACADTPCGDRSQDEDVLRAAQRTGVPAAIAAAQLNLGALLWQQGESDAAYQAIRDAQGRFAESGDSVGLALCHEWIGFMMLQSGAAEIAGEHLALAHQLYQRLGDEAAEDRLLGYLR